MVTYESIIQFTREHSREIIKGMELKVADHFISRVNDPNFNDVQELKEIKIEQLALSKTQEILEKVLERMEKGA